MKRRVFCVVFVLLAFAALAFSEDVSFTLTTDAAYYPLSTPIPAAAGNRFAPITGPYDGVEARTTGNLAYTIPVPFGDGPLVRGNTLSLNASLELTPISVKPGVSFSLTPIAFLVFSGGADVGSGWKLTDGLFPLGSYDAAAHTYVNDGSFSGIWYDFWAEGMFQFDLAAIVPGDWNHIVTQDTFRVSYAGRPEKADGEPWKWQATTESVNGWFWNATLIFAYQMPLVLNTVGIQTEISGRFQDDLSAYANYKSDMTLYAVNPVAIFKFSDNDSLTTQFSFASRRGYSTIKDPDTQTDLDMTTTGLEWYFKRLAFSWKHTF